MIKRRYAAQSLARHTAIGLLDIDSKGQLQKDATKDKYTDLCRFLFNTKKILEKMIYLHFLKYY